MLKAIIKEAWISISSYKLRTFLTMLGIMIGVAAVVMMVSAGQAVQLHITKSFSSMGSNRIFISPAELVTGGVRGARGLPSVTIDDVRALKELKGVKNASYEGRTPVQVVYGSNNYGTTVYGTNPDILEVNNEEIEDGVMFTEKDVKGARPYAVIGQTMVNELFGIQNPIGKTIRLKGQPFKVIGTLKEQGDGLFGNDMDNLIYIPYTTLRQRLSGSERPKYVDMAYVVVENEQDIEVVSKRIEYLLRSRHRLKDGVKNDFQIRPMTDFINKVRGIGFVLSTLLAVIASISLIVGSIGIMNMMLVSVTERTREIGTRKALGAPNNWIMAQFLTESILISFIGSFIGMISGIINSQLAGKVLGYEVPISIWSVIVSVSVAIIVGVVSGLMPALKAMRLNPIDALRYQ
ncbi:MAG: ABC transporter permease [Alphaproteobacteria bacterium]|nr:ABC transporter permease [Alphaproteobacteria bacterium]